ncbi:hypothetical protein LCGC14_0391980 [marine sediment metagenome]|uniref:Uncharacterized protein n=1 Tax=marine sediment metagenome TaxID=412755 RepID=A0A0F9T535_9ZZZZ
MLYLLAETTEVGVPTWMQVGAGGLFALFVLRLVFDFLKDYKKKKNGHNGQCKIESIERVILRGRTPDKAMLQENEKDKALNQLAKDMAENVKEQKRTRHISQAALARSLGVHPRELKPDETGVGMPAILDDD